MSRMKLFGFKQGFKIRSKADAQKFLNMADDPDFCKYDGEIYWTDGETDYCLNAKIKTVSTRSTEDRKYSYSLFLPYCDDGDKAGYLDKIWKTRKHINSQWFTPENW